MSYVKAQKAPGEIAKLVLVDFLARGDVQAEMRGVVGDLTQSGVDYLIEAGSGKVVSLVTFFQNRVGWCVTDSEYRGRGFAEALLRCRVSNLIENTGSAYFVINSSSGGYLAKKIKPDFPALNVEDPNNLLNLDWGSLVLDRA